MLSMVLIKNVDGSSNSYIVDGVRSVSATDSYIVVEDVKGVLRSFSFESVNYVYYVDMDFMKEDACDSLYLDNANVMLYSKQEGINLLHTDFITNFVDNDIRCLEPIDNRWYRPVDDELDYDVDVVLVDEEDIEDDDTKSDLSDEENEKINLLCRLFELLYDLNDGNDKDDDWA